MTAPAKRISTFEEFWPFYLGEHALPATRWMHFFGSTCALGFAISALVTMSWQPLIGALFSGYGFAWVSHFFIEKNKPASFKYPGWSFIADWRMWFLIATRRLDTELIRIGQSPQPSPKTVQG